jgi:hypothetical protein
MKIMTDYRKCKMLLEMIKNAYTKYYNPSKHLAVDKVTVLFKGRAVFKQHIPKKHKVSA